jgi:tetratricopeptide (TPR) repeat protein
VNSLNLSRGVVSLTVTLLIAGSVGSSMLLSPLQAAETQIISQGSVVFLGVAPKTTMEQISELKKHPETKEAWLQIRTPEEAQAACQLTELEKLKLVVYRSDGRLSFGSDEQRRQNKETSDKMERALEKISDLKNLRELDLAFMETSCSPDGILKQVEALPNLKKLALMVSCGIGSYGKEPAVTAHVPVAKSVTELKLSGYGIAYAIPAAFPWEQIESLEVDDVIPNQSQFRRLTKLKTFAGHHLKFNEDGLKGLSHARNLEAFTSSFDSSRLPISYWRQMKKLRLSNVAAKSFNEIAKLKDLQELELTVKECSDADLQKLGSLGQLQSLSISASETYEKGQAIKANIAANGSGFQALKNSRHLTRLHVSGIAATNELLSAIGKITSLQKLYVYDGTISQSQMKLLQQLTNLEDVHLPWQAKKKWESLQVATNWRKLKQVRLNEENLLDNQIEALLNFPGLERLSLSSNKLTDRAFDTISKLQNLQHLELDGNPIEGKELHALALMPNLTELQLSNTAISDRSLLNNPPRSTSVKILHLAGNKAIRGPGLAALSGMSALQQLSVGGTSINDEGLKNLKSDSLESLGLGDTDVTEHGIEWLSTLPKLKTVSAHGCGIKYGTQFPKNLAVASQVGWYSYDYDDAKAKQENKQLNETFIRMRLGNGKISELAHHQRAEMYKAVGEYKNACDEYDKAIDDLVHPKYYVCSLMATGHSGRIFECYDSRGMAHAALGHYDKALDDLNKAVQMARASAYARTHRGYVFFKMGKLKEALGDLDRAIDINPKIAAAYQYRSEVHAALGNTDLARADAEKSRSLGYVPELAPPVREAVKDLHRVP